MNSYSILLGLFGGLGLFIYGMNLSAKELKKVAGFKIRKTIDKLTNSIFLAILLGIAVTALLQSSSATTVLLVSFINASVITFAKTIGVIIGANIGTTITVQLISFNFEEYAVPIVGLAVSLSFFNKTKTLSKILLGFGLLFLGLFIMKEAVVPLQNNNMFQNYILKFNELNFVNFILLLTFSSIITAVIQASGATLGVLIALASSGVLNNFEICIPVMLGARLGTCITAFLASISSNRDGKRIALTHFVFNIISVILTIVFMSYLVKISLYSSSSLARQIANAHSFISIFTAFIVAPFTSYFIKLIEYFIPVRKDEDSRLDIFNSNYISNPDLAIGSIKKAIINMADTTKKMLDLSNDTIFKNNNDFLYKIKILEDKVNYYQFNIRYFLLEISKNELSGYEALELSALREMTDDFERIADHIDNINENVPFLEIVDNQNLELNIIKKVYEHININYSSMIDCFMDSNIKKANEILKEKQSEKTLFKENIIHYNELIRNGKIDAKVGISLIDILYNMQRIAFHIRRILFNVININLNCNKLPKD